MLRVLEQDVMVGNGEEASKLQLVLNICGLTLSREGHPVQYDLDEQHWGERDTALKGAVGLALSDESNPSDPALSRTREEKGRKRKGVGADGSPEDFGYGDCLGCVELR